MTSDDLRSPLPDVNKTEGYRDQATFGAVARPSGPIGEVDAQKQGGPWSASGAHYGAIV